MRTQTSLGRLAVLATVGLAGALSQSTQAAQIFYDGFDYPTGAVLMDNGWNGQEWSGSFADTVDQPLSYPGVSVVGGSANVYEGGVFKNFVLPDGTSEFYVSALVKKTNGAGSMGIYIGDGWNGTRLCGFGVGGTTLFASDGGFVGYGSNGGNGAVDLTNTTTLMVAHIVGGASGTITVWDYADPSNTASYDYVHGSAGAPKIVDVWGSYGAAGLIDEVKIGTALGDVVPVPEPACIGLVGLGALMAVRRRRQA